MINKISFTAYQPVIHSSGYQINNINKSVKNDNTKERSGLLWASLAVIGAAGAYLVSKNIKGVKNAGKNIVKHSKNHSGELNKTKRSSNTKDTKIYTDSRQQKLVDSEIQNSVVTPNQQKQYDKDMAYKPLTKKEQNVLDKYNADNEKAYAEANQIINRAKVSYNTENKAPEKLKLISEESSVIKRQIKRLEKKGEDTSALKSRLEELSGEYKKLTAPSEAA